MNKLQLHWRLNTINPFNQLINQNILYKPKIKHLIGILTIIIKTFVHHRNQLQSTNYRRQQLTGGNQTTPEIEREKEKSKQRSPEPPFTIVKHLLPFQPSLTTIQHLLNILNNLEPPWPDWEKRAPHNLRRRHNDISGKDRTRVKETVRNTTRISRERPPSEFASCCRKSHLEAVGIRILSPEIASWYVTPFLAANLIC